MKKRNLALFLAALIAITCIFSGCGQKENKVIRISTTTSVNDSGLLGYLQPIFESDTGYKLEIASAGTGAAIESAKLGNADLILVHSKTQEESFIADGYARSVDGQPSERISFMYNYFVIVGGNDDVAKVRGSENASAAFKAIYDNKATFFSRGDKSGTHSAEIKIWKSANITDITLEGAPKEYTWYNSMGQGMGLVLTAANEKSGYTLSDKATYLSYKNDKGGDKLPNLTLLMEESDEMKNTYSMIAVNEKKFETKTNTVGADVFINWMLKESTKKLINEYGLDLFGEQLFYTINK